MTRVTSPATSANTLLPPGSSGSDTGASTSKTAAPSADITAAVDFVAGNDHFFLNLSMATCKTMLDAAHGVSGSSMVTAMARNGVEFGIRVSGSGNRWFTTRAPIVDGLFFPGYSAADAAPDLGDSAIGRNHAFTLPPMNFAGTPAGIDVRKVVDSGIQPVINTGIAHREAGVGQIGAGITYAPLGCFTQAVSALASEMRSSR